MRKQPLSLFKTISTPPKQHKKRFLRNLPKKSVNVSSVEDSRRVRNTKRVFFILITIVIFLTPLLITFRNQIIYGIQYDSQNVIHHHPMSNLRHLPVPFDPVYPFDSDPTNNKQILITLHFGFYNDLPHSFTVTFPQIEKDDTTSQHMVGAKLGEVVQKSYTIIGNCYLLMAMDNKTKSIVFILNSQQRTKKYSLTIGEFIALGTTLGKPVIGFTIAYNPASATSTNGWFSLYAQTATNQFAYKI